jgi:hypothetical protein
MGEEIDAILYFYFTKRNLKQMGNPTQKLVAWTQKREALIKRAP